MTTSKTHAFLGPNHFWPAATISLDDVQALHGGVQVAVNGRGQAQVTRQAPGGSRHHYRFQLTDEERRRLFQLCLDHDFLTISPAERPGIPDEARPVITLGNGRAGRHSVAKWAGVADARFEAIYQALLAVANQAEQHPVYRPPMVPPF